MRSLYVILATFILLIIQASLVQYIPFDMFIPSLSFPVIMYLGLHDESLTRGVVLTFVIGYLTDAFAGSPIGLYTFVYVVVFLISRIASLRLFMQGWIFEIILTFALAVVASVVILAIRAVFDKNIGGLLIDIKIVPTRSAATAIAAPLIFKLVARIIELTPGRKGDGRIVRK